jgi:protease FtsH subunit HflC
MKKAAIIIALIVVASVIICLKASLYVVDVRQQAVITQFGRPVKTVTDPGLCVKTPFIQEVRYFE